MHPTLTNGILNKIEAVSGDKVSDFFKAHSEVKSWLLAADFCHDKRFPNRSFAITLIPVINSVQSIVRKIRKSAPKDIKHIKKVSHLATELINSSNYFHFAFIINDPVAVFTEGSDDERSETISRIEQIYEGVTVTPAPKHLLKPFKKLLQASKEKRFDLTLNADMMLFSALVTGLICLISKHVNPQRIGIFPDRDKITDSHDSIYFNLIAAGVQGYFKFDKKINTPFNLDMAKPNSSGPMWFDDLIRMPDYIASFVAQWDHATLPDPDTKASALFYRSFVDTGNIVVINVRLEDGVYLESIRADTLPAQTTELPNPT